MSAMVDTMKMLQMIMTDYLHGSELVMAGKGKGAYMGERRGTIGSIVERFLCSM